MRRPTHPVVHLELHTSDARGAGDFYARLFGWRPERVHAGGGSYVALELADRFGGGIVQCPGARPLWLPYVQVACVGAATEQARDLGAAVLLEPREGPEGWRSVVASAAGAEIAFWQPRRRR